MHVYSFGVLLTILLTGRSVYFTGSEAYPVDFSIILSTFSAWTMLVNGSLTLHPYPGRERKRRSRENGSSTMEALCFRISSLTLNGISNPIRFFSAGQILKATDGCSLEFPLPVMVFEYPENGVLNEPRGCVEGALLPWNVRLGIAKEVAVAVTYLHTAFPSIIIHRDVKHTNVFLDKNWKAKLTDFTFSVTFGYIDPVYAMTGFVTEHTDVYSFGILMLVLLMGRPATFASSCGVLCNILDYVKHLRARGEPVEFRGNSNDMEPSQMKMFLDLALRCCEERHKDRPKMILYMIFTVKTFILIKKEFDEHSDRILRLYSFEIFMLVLLIGMEPIMDATDHDHIHSYVKYMQKRGEPVELWGDSDNMRLGQMKMFLDLALRCCEKRTEDRPKMITVAKEIKLIEQKKGNCKITHKGDGILEKGKARKCFLKNGRIFLEKLIADCNGMSNPIRMFTSDQINKATNHFDPNCSLPELSSKYSYLWFTLYKGVIDGRSYVIKRFTKKTGVEGEETTYNDFVLSLRVNLEYRALNIRGSVGPEDGPVLPWNVRLKIAKEVATAITYLQTAFPRIIVHRNIKPTNVFLDMNGTAKLTAFSLAVTLPEGKTWIKDTVAGTYGYGDPIYFKTGVLTEYSDVFSFGILMLILLLGRPLCSDGSDGNFYNNILDYVKDLRERGEPVEFWRGSNDMSPGQMKMFLELALRCCEERNEDKPKMILVAKLIKLIEQASL
ncbi:unnamed protein product [Brassica oleracea var. botrytis]|uniref:Protein kinase domain-containing protein n=3 Tax=Brassica TaxID=3705 RepID=A0A0D3BX74_BRAOL|nr:unnamed protein product [Brassica napus]CDY64285.1 BnaCnng43680D [Brassica napus]VDD09572.1 unnamed protein product [Brassica oleracea]